jgi:hypothetical protein
MKCYGRLAVLTVFALTGIIATTSYGAAVSESEVLALIEKAAPHPRLLVDAEALALIQQRLETQENTKALFDSIRKEADSILNDPPQTYSKTGRRLLSVSREVLRRITTLGIVYRLTSEERYAMRAIQEMETVAAFSDWNPSHFLDVAEMTTALAIGYDWLHEVLTTKQEELIRKAILEKGINPSFNSPHWWIRGNNNWNQVCHGGMVFGVLALLEHEPDLATKTILRAMEGLPNAMKEYEPDGIYPEGPSYWQYGTSFNVLLIAALESALGTDFGITASPGFLESGAFPLLMTGPTGEHFNFSDCGNHGGPYPAVYWFAQRTKDTGLAWYEHPWLEKVLQGKASAGNRFLSMLLLWWDGSSPEAPKQPLHWKGDGINPLAVHRSSWSDPNAVFLAVKAGTPYANHGHMDVGSFILEADGVRWAVDLGAQDYNDMESRGLDIWNRNQDSDRWHIYRYHNRSHNTLLVDDIGQVVKGKAAITNFSDDPAFPHTIMDMSEVYAGQLAQAQRGFALLPDGRVMIQDEVSAGDTPEKVRWAMTTPAEITEVDQGAATLSLNGKNLNLQTLIPIDTAIEVFSTDPPNEWDAPNPGTRQVGFYVELEAQESKTITVLLTPGSVMDKAKEPPQTRPLASWTEK